MAPSAPFEQLMTQAREQAAVDPLAVWNRLEELVDKILTSRDVRDLAALAAHLGGGGLGRWDETIAFLRRMLDHEALEAEGDDWRSIQRALCVVATGAGDNELANGALARGVATDAERCRVAALCAQTLAARQRLHEAAPHLAQAGELVSSLAANDEVVGQLALIANGITQLAEKRLRGDQECLLRATGALRAALERASDWNDRHKAMYQQAKAEALAGRPAQALAIVQEMMAFEEAVEAGPEPRFHTASLAARAQLVRGQFKIARAALRAARSFAEQLEGQLRQRMEAHCDELAAEIDAAVASVG